MFINFWYPIGLSTEITGDKPFKAQVFGLPFVAFRDTSGAAQVVSDTCVHRGGALHKGLVRDGTVVCPYPVASVVTASGQVPRSVMTERPARAKAMPIRADVRLSCFLGDRRSGAPPLDEVEYVQPGWNSIPTF